MLTYREFWCKIGSGITDITKLSIEGLNMKLSLIVPCYNEQDNVELFYSETVKAFADVDFDYEFVIDPEILNCESLNLILQPLVENAILHGVEKKTDGERGKIEIRGWQQEGCIWFSVEDNGDGMDAVTAKQILTVESKGYGVRNVCERIQLFYGEEYKMEVNSEPGKGTIMRLHFPIRKKEI